jgi:DMSO/TMAO reductase YedYZ molybdopterin-dependent catalytic subunit
MSIFSRRNADREKWGGRLPPGQKDTGDGWPVLHYGGVPRIDLDSWRFEMGGLVEEPVVMTWQDFMAMPQTQLRSDIHCVTAWSKFDNDWEGVSFQDLMSRVRLKPGARYAMAHSYGGYTTNLSLEDLMQPGVLLAHSHNGQPLTKEHGWPLRLVIPHLYFWKSAKWVRGFVFFDQDRPGFWEMYGYHMRGDPWKEERYS